MKPIQTIAVTELVSNKILELAAYCAYYARAFEQAVSLWDAREQTSQQEYRIAKAECGSFPENISLFVDAKFVRPCD